MMRYRFNLLWSCLLLLYSDVCQSNVWTRSLNSSPLEFATFLRAYPENQSFVDHALENPISNEVKREIYLKLETAEQQFRQLSSAMAEQSAEKNYRDITAMALRQDWPDLQRQMIFRSYLRLFQISEDPNWLTEGAHFAPDLTPAPDHFPPSLVSEYEKVHKGIPFIKVHASDLVGPYDVAVMNGRVVRISDGIVLLPPKPFRLTRIANQYHKESRIISGNLLEELRQTSPNPFHNGHCQDNIAPQVFVSLDCVQNQIAEANTEKNQINSSQLDWPKPVTTQRAEVNWLQRNWKWGAFIAIAVSGALYLSQREVAKKTRIENVPTEHSPYGYRDSN